MIKIIEKLLESLIKKSERRQAFWDQAMLYDDNPMYVLQYIYYKIICEIDLEEKWELEHALKALKEKAINEERNSAP